MKFRLFYQGKPKSSQTKSKGKANIHQIRRNFHKQLKILWQQEPLRVRQKYHLHESGHRPHTVTVGNFSFVSLVHSSTFLVCSLDILFLRPAPPGALFEDGGDIDNRVKTLIDALRVPKAGEIPEQWVPEEDEEPLHCLLEDDKLITQFSVTTDRMLVDQVHEQEVLLVVHVIVQASRAAPINLVFTG